MHSPFEHGVTPATNVSLANSRTARPAPTIGSLRRHLLYEPYGLKDNPFGPTPNPRYIYLSRTHAEARSSLVIGIECGVGFQALIAPPGMGKTMLLRQLLERFAPVARTAFLFQVQGDSRDFVSYLLAELGADPNYGDVVRAQGALNELLLSEFRARRQTIIAIDEAQNLSPSILETLRQLSNFETTGEKLLQIVIAGQPQLADTLADPALTQLRQRISMFATLAPFDLQETTHYIEHRLRVAGFEGPALFSPEAIRLIWERSMGIPRTINVLCLNALLLAASSQHTQITHTIVLEVLQDRDLERVRCSPEAMPGVIPIEERIRSPEADLSHEQSETESDCGTSVIAPGPRPERGSLDDAGEEKGTARKPYSPVWPVTRAEPELIPSARPDPATEPGAPPQAELDLGLQSALVATPLSTSPLKQIAGSSVPKEAGVLLSRSSDWRIVHWMGVLSGLLIIGLLTIVSGGHSRPDRLMGRVQPVHARSVSLSSSPPARAATYPTVASTFTPSHYAIPKPTKTRRRSPLAIVRPVALVVPVNAQPIAIPGSVMAVPDPPSISSVLSDRQGSDSSYFAGIFAEPTTPSERAVRVSQGTLGGELIEKTLPLYPSWPKEQRLEGDVVLQVAIDKQGGPKSVQLVSGAQTFASAAMNAVRHWRYEPVYLDGQAVEWKTTIMLHFRLPQHN